MPTAWTGPALAWPPINSLGDWEKAQSLNVVVAVLPHLLYKAKLITKRMKR